MADVNNAAASSTAPAPLRIIPQIHRATHRIGLHIAAMLGVTQAEAHVLQHLASVDGDCTVGDLHRAFAHRRSTLTSVLDRLTEKKLVERTSSESDRRTFVISLTTDGRVVALKVHAELEQVERQVVASVIGRDLKGFATVLGELEKALTAGTEAAE